MEEQQITESVLKPYRVLDLTDEKGFLCGKVLGDLGAEVIKIEPPGGDPSRNIGPFYKDIPDPEKSLFWFAYNTSKQGITLDIEKEDGKEIFKELIKHFDLVIESYQPGYMERLGLDYLVLQEINPGIILTSITPFGKDGPYGDFKGADIVLWGMGGMLYLSGDDDRPPTQVSVPQAYLHGGLHGAMASMFALYYKEMTGEGQYVDVSIQQAVLWATYAAPETWDVNKVVRRRTGPFFIAHRSEQLGELRTRLTWPCKDGFVSYSFPGGVTSASKAGAQHIVKMMNKEGLGHELKDYDWGSYDALTITQEERDELDKRLLEFVATKTKAQLYEMALNEGIMLAPLNNIEDLVESPHLAARGFWEIVEHPELGAYLTYPGAPIKLNQSHWGIQCRAPLVGEHNQEVYKRYLGLSKEHLLLLKQAGVI